MRVTLYTQQVRALNLAWALREDGRLRPGTRVIVIGGGAAGLTFAAAASQLEAKVVVLERQADVLPLQRNCYKRHLHPHIYDWPNRGSTNPDAGLPLLSWRAGMARDVAGAIDRGFREATERSNGTLRCFTSVDNLQFDIEGEVTFRSTVDESLVAKRTTESYDLLIFAVGFGIEKSLWMGARGSYWADDSLDQGGVFEPGEYLVSGTGDGGVIDVLRIALRNFRQEELGRIVEYTASFESLKRELTDIDLQATNARPQEQERILLTRYANIKSDLVDSVDKRIKTSLNADARVTLLSRSATPFSLKASTLHRLFLSRLYFTFPKVLTVLPGVNLKAKSLRSLSREPKVAFRHGTDEKLFDHVIVRHGPKPSIDSIIELAAVSAIPGRTDRTVAALFGDAFGGPRAAAWSGGPNKHDYLQAVESVVSRTTGVAGKDVDLISFKDVAMELRVATTDASYHSANADAEESADGNEKVASLGAWRIVKPITGQAVYPYLNRTTGVRFLKGKAGAGKTTFLKLSALTEARRHLSEDSSSDLPIYITCTVDVPDTEDGIVDALTDAALKSAQVPGFTSAAADVRSAIARAQVAVFIDNVDDWLPAQFHSIVAWLDKHRIRGILAGRRLPAIAASSRTDELMGLAPGSTSAYLGAHFPDKDAETLDQFVDSIQAASSRGDWTTNPFLLSRAAWLYFERPASFTSPLSRLSLYGVLVASGLERVPAERRDAAKARLTELATQNLCRNIVRLTVNRHDVEPETLRRDILQTGLISGGDRLEFAHLTIGEYLAAGRVECSKEREILLNDGAADTWQDNLEILPMAHAASADELGATLKQLAKGDADHRLLVLLLESIGYGGPAVEHFCKATRTLVVQEVAGRLCLASARFGERERALMRAFQRAAPALQGASLNFDLPMFGEPGAEAWALAASLGFPIKPDPPPDSIYWATIYAQARLLLNKAPREVVALTQGGDSMDRLTALRALTRVNAAPANVLAMLHSRDSVVRERTVRVLRSETRLSHRFLGMFGDERERVRTAALDTQVACREQWSTAARQDVIISILRHKDSSLAIKSSAIQYLSVDDRTLSLLCSLMDDLTPRTEPQSVSSTYEELVGEVLTHLAQHPNGQPVVEKFLGRESTWSLCSESAWTDLCLKRERIQELLGVRLRSRRPSIGELRAAGKLIGLLPVMRERLSACLADDEMQHLAIDILYALPTKDEDSRQVRSACLEGPTTAPADSTRSGRTSRHLRIAAIASFAGDSLAFDALRKIVEGDDAELAGHALKALGDDPRATERAWHWLRNGLSGERIEAAGYLGRQPPERNRLWDYFTTLPPHGLGARDPKHDYSVRITIAVACAEFQSTEALTNLLHDANDYVRRATVTALRDRPEAYDILATLAIRDPSSAVREVLWPKFASVPEVKEQLEVLLRDDGSHLRHAYFSLVSSDRRRPQELRALFREALAQGSHELVAELIPAVARDKDMLPELRSLLSGDNYTVRAALLRSLHADPELRREVHTRLSEGGIIRDMMVPFESALTEYLTDDPSARGLLLAYLERDGVDGDQVARIAPLLHGFGPAREALINYADDSSAKDAVQALLVDEPDVLARLCARLDAEEARERENAAEILLDSKRELARVADRLTDDSAKVRRFAYEAATLLRRPPGRLMDIAKTEPDDTARQVLIRGLTENYLQSSEYAIDLRSFSRWCVANDWIGGTRRLAGARLVRARPGGMPLRAVWAASGATRGGPLEISLTRFIGTPVELVESAAPELFSSLLMWACAKLASTMPDDSAEMATYTDVPTALYGEIFPEVPSEGSISLRLAQDAALLPRDRNILPVANVVAAWDTISYLRSDRPRAIVLACADLDLSELDYPVPAPGEVLLGPTFYGFGLNRS